jgi:hypothetical protein
MKKFHIASSLHVATACSLPLDPCLNFSPFGFLLIIRGGGGGEIQCFLKIDSYSGLRKEILKKL